MTATLPHFRPVFACLTLASALLLTAGCGDKKETAAETKSTAACSSAMFDKYKLAAFSEVNDAIIDKATAAGAETRLGTSFQALAAKGADRVTNFRTNLANFLVAAYGGPNNYTGPDMITAHTGLAITSEQYDSFITTVVVPALSEKGVTEDDITNCFAPVVTDADFKASIVGR